MRKKTEHKGRSQRKGTSWPAQCAIPDMLGIKTKTTQDDVGQLADFDGNSPAWRARRKFKPRNTRTKSIERTGRREDGTPDTTDPKQTAQGKVTTAQVKRKCALAETLWRTKPNTKGAQGVDAVTQARLALKSRPLRAASPTTRPTKEITRRSWVAYTLSWKANGQRTSTSRTNRR